MFLSRNKKNNIYRCKPQFYYIKVGFRGVKIIWYVFMMSFSFYVHPVNARADQSLCCLPEEAMDP